MQSLTQVQLEPTMFRFFSRTTLMSKSNMVRAIYLASALGALHSSLRAQSPAASETAEARERLEREFQNPPNSARPRVWWHWMNGNVSLEGIRLDLDWMQRAGLGGLTVFQGSIDTPQVVPKRLEYMSPEWKTAFKAALDQSMRQNFEFAIASSAGWSETGGPWVPPSQAMKKLVWSEVMVEGGKPFHGMLPPPPRSTGTFQNYSIEAHHEPGKPSAPLPQFSARVAVIAYRVPDEEQSQVELHPAVTASGGTVDVPALSDGDVETPAVALLSPPGGPGAWLLFDYGKPQAIQSVTLASTDDMVSFFGFDADEKSFPRVEASDDGQSFHVIAALPFSSIPQRTISFAPVSARYFRVLFPASPAGAKPHTHQLTELVLNNGARTNQWERRAGFATTANYYEIPDSAASPQFVTPRSDVVDLTAKVAPDGTLDWAAPAGHWRILNFGESLVGRENGPAPAEATGLEVDKFNRNDVRTYLDQYLQTYSDTVGAAHIGHRGITYMVTDSVEMGAQNWTDEMLAEFQRRRGYDARPWLPALTGVVLGSTADTDRFLWDFRRTIAQLFAENHYGIIAEELHKHGLGYYGEALEFRRPSLGDDMEMRSRTDIPMAAMWTFKEEDGPNPTYIADVRGAASVAHIYGQNLVAAESMTAGPPPWIWSPNTLKRIADMELVLGINRFEIHESTHQPLVNKVPGLTLGKYGQWFNRNETWAEDAKPWIEYLARSSYLLQQGHFYADVAYFYGEEAPLTSLFGIHGVKDSPEGYGFDFVNSDVLLNQLTVRDGRLMTSTGTSYRVLYLGGTSRRMTLPVLRKLVSLVREGAVIVGNRPDDSPSLADSPADFKSVADLLWGEQPSNVAYHEVGEGRVYSNASATNVLAKLGIPRDFEYTKPSPDTRLLVLHRQCAQGVDIYFVDSRNDRAQDIDATFRTSGKQPELWDASTGTSRPLAFQSKDGRTSVPLHLDPYGAVFVVFRSPAKSSSEKLPSRIETVLATDPWLDRNWHISFQPDRGAPASANFYHLGSWSDNADSGIRYFSGTATYDKDIVAPAAWFNTGARLLLDLGVVHEIASVEVNGKPVGIAWKSPYRIDVTGALRPGHNHIKIAVTNLWVNRLIGDAQPNAARRYTFTDIVPYRATDPLLPSGLLGPIRFISASDR
jgi:hypothetical protein